METLLSSELISRYESRERNGAFSKIANKPVYITCGQENRVIVAVSIIACTGYKITCRI